MSFERREREERRSPPGFERRQIVSVEDHLYHTAELLETMARVCPELVAWTTVCTIDDPGPDTSAAIALWLDRFAGVQVAARVDPRDFSADHARRLFAIDAGHLAAPSAFAKMVASFLMPDGVLVQDVHLSTLDFVPADRWWESIYLAATVRGLFARYQPAVRFVSNKRGYAATFGRDLMDAGFDPREVMDKAELEQVIVPSIAADVDSRFPLELTIAGRPAAMPLAGHDHARREVEQELDLVEWEVNGRVELGGRLLVAPVIFRPGSQEGLTWQRLIAGRLDDGPGVTVAEVGQRLAEAGADRAEISNLAARHIHALRARLAHPAAIVTANRAYGLDVSVTVGRVRRRRPGHLQQPPVSRLRRPDPPA
jgi:hypothetical protein